MKLDKTRNLFIGFKGMQIFKRTVGTSLAKLDYENEDMEDYIPAIFYCGLVHEDNELTLEVTTDLIDKHLGIAGAIALIPEIMEETFGKEEDIKNAQRVAKKK